MTQDKTAANSNESEQLPKNDTAEQQAGPEAEIARLNDELAKMRDQWIRAVAEADNIRKRAQKEKEETSRYAITGFASEMVNVLENLKRACESIPADATGQNELLKTLGEGVNLTLQELLGIFQRFGIQRLDPLGQKFDHNFHQAVAQVERDDVEPGLVAQVVQAGYIIHDRLLRPAMVVVTKQPAPRKHVDTSA